MVYYNFPILHGHELGHCNHTPFLGKPISGLPTLAAGNMDVADGGAAARCALEMIGINSMRGA
jgi:hypothetical protein